MSTYAKLAAAAILALALAAFGWSMYHKGEVAGQATVQDKWDKQTASIESKTAAAVAESASEAMANYHQAGTSAELAEQHKADQATFQKTIIKRVQDYANQHQSRVVSTPGSARTTDGQSMDHGGNADSCGLSADGLRIWNDSNAGINSDAVGASGSSAVPAAALP